ncbi:hypothetical protein JCM3770_007096, partial [Rhodotorula araucariae]
LNAYAASAPASGVAWCGTSLAIAQAAGSPLTQQIEMQFQKLQVRYTVKEEEEEVLV